MPVTVIVVVRLKIPDVTAATALYTVRQRLGHSEVQRLTRADVYRLHIDAQDAAAAVETARAIVQGTALFMNPNKHTVEYLVNDPPPAAGTAQVEVRLSDDARAGLLSDALRGDPRFASALVGVEQATRWTLQGQGDMPAAARDLAVATHRCRGLFANPHAQDAVVR